MLTVCQAALTIRWEQEPSIYTRMALYRIYGTNEPDSIGLAVSNGCIRMLDDHVMELYDRVPLGAPVLVL